MPSSYIFYITTDPDLLTRLREMLANSAHVAPESVKLGQPNRAVGGFVMATNRSDLDEDPVAAGRAVYAKLQESLEAENSGSFVVIDAGSGDYEVDPSPAAARRRLMARQPAPELYERRIGRLTSYKLVSIRHTGRDD